MNKYLQPSGINSDFHGQGLSFSNYILHMQDIIRQARLDLDSPHASKIIAANSPQEFIPNKKPRYGVLLIHGLLASPFVMQDLFNVFRQENALVRSLLLPGHGTVVGDLTEVDADAWRQCVARGVEWMQQDVDKLVIIGFSAGGALALEYVLEKKIKAILILIAPALKIQNPLSPLTRVARYISDWLPSLKWIKQVSEDDYTRYNSLPTNAVYQVQRLTKNINHLLNTHSCEVPIFITASLDDEVISVNAICDFITQKAGEQSGLWLYGTPKSLIEDARISYRTSSYPEFRILDFSHVSLPNGVDNPHCGVNAEYKDLSHYQTPLGKAMMQPHDPNNSYLGSLSLNNLRKHYIQRLGFNPDFPALSKAMVDFVDAHVDSLHE